MNKVIIIGADGFLGNRLARFLINHDIQVVAFVPKGFDYSNVTCLTQVTCVEFSFGHLDTLDNIEPIKGVDTIYNMAWIGVNSKDQNNALLQLSNVTCNLEVAEFAKRNGIKKLIIPGSAAQYACSGNVIDGTGEPAPSDFYSAAKVATYYYCSTYCNQNGIDLIWPLITSIYGTGRSDNNLLTYVIKSLLNGEIPSTTKLEQRWDYLHVDDLMQALWLLGQKGKGGRVYPTGSGECRTLREFVEMIRDAINPNLPIGIGEIPYKNKKIDNQELDISLLKKDTGFSPSFSFSEGILDVIEFFRPPQKPL